MIEYRTGDLLASTADALVNTVNTVGVMGKGVAFQFKKRFPDNYQAYRDKADVSQIKIGQMYVFETKSPRRVIINFPTKQHWRSPSKQEWIESGLKDLKSVIKNQGIKSIAIPALGCGHGGLDWDVIRPIIEQELADLIDVRIELYGPESSTRLPEQTVSPQLALM